MTDTTISGTSTSAQSITGGNRLIISAGALLKPGGPAVTFALNSSGTETLENSGSIAPTSGRALDTSNNTPSSPLNIVITNFTGASIIGVSDVMRVQKGLGGGDFTVTNSGTIQANGGRGFNVQEYVGGGHYSFTNNSGATIQSTDDTIRLTTNGAGATVSNNNVFTGIFSIDNTGTIKSVGVGSGQAIDLGDVNATSAGHVTVTNHAGGVIESGDADAIRGSRFAEIDNSGTIQSKNGNSSSTGNDAIDFQSNDGGVVNNLEGGQIIGARHGITGNAPIAITNDGSIEGQSGSGINLDTGTTTTSLITNQAHGTITGHASGAVDGDGVDVDGLVTIINDGTIQSLGHSTVGSPPPLAEAITVGGGSITNNLGGLIISDERAITVDDSNGGNAFAATTITNAGTITGANGEAIVIIDSFADTIDNSGTINGSISTGGGADHVINSGTITGAISTGDGDDIITLAAGNSTAAIDGGAGTDTLIAQSAYTAIGFASLAGIEAIDGGGFANVTIIGTAGDDSLDFSGITLTGIAAIKGGDGVDSITGSAGADTIWGEAGDDSLYGGDGNDLILAGTGNDSVYGGEGDDQIAFRGVSGADLIDGGAGTDTLIAQAANTAITFASLAGIEAIDGSGFANVTIVGTAGDDILDFSALTLTDIAVIHGGAGADTITGSAGADTIWGDAGDDSLYGGIGNDMLFAGAGNDGVYGGDGDDLIAFRGSITSNGYDAIDGGAGTDTLIALAANTAIGFASITGIETIDGGGFANVFIVGTTGDDSLDFSGITLTGIAAIKGGAGADTIIGSAGADTIWGEAGNDTLYGGTGDDHFVIAGAPGIDAIYGGDGTDTIVAGANNTRISLSAIGGVEAIDGGAFTGVSIVGTSGADTLDLTGVQTSHITAIDMGAGNDTLIGSDSGDLIRGGAGADELSGGLGDDIFAYRATSESRGATIDTIKDFTIASDTIDLSAIDANSRTAGDQLFSFIGSDAFHNVAGELRVDYGTPGITTVTGDLNGDGRVDFEIHLTGNVPLTATDFVL